MNVLLLVPMYMIHRIHQTLIPYLNEFVAFDYIQM